VTGCAVANQPGSGIVTGGGVVENCTVYTTNGASAFNSAGISAGHGTNVRNCTIRSVISAGVFVSGDSVVEGCQISQCKRGIAASQFASGRMVIKNNDINDSTTMAIDLPSGKHLIIGNRLRGNVGTFSVNAAVVLGEVVNCGPGTPPAAASNLTANLVW
jgi:hypothetical protein